MIPQEDGSILVATGGWKNDEDYTSTVTIAADDPNIDVWRWVYENAAAFPQTLRQPFFEGIIKAYREGPPEISTPQNGYYFVKSEASGLVVVAMKKLEAAHASKPFPRPLYIVDGDSSEPMERFPHLAGTLSGQGELLGFVEGACDLYMHLGEDLTSLSRVIDFLYRWNSSE